MYVKVKRKRYRVKPELKKTNVATYLYIEKIYIYIYKFRMGRIILRYIHNILLGLIGLHFYNRLRERDSNVYIHIFHYVITLQDFLKNRRGILFLNNLKILSKGMDCSRMEIK